MNGDTVPRYHSVILDEEECKGCTVCVTTCPVEAIRVRGGKARITAERCIDCGECIRRCPHHAKKARADIFPPPANNEPASPNFRIALPAPSLYGQFPELYSIADIHEALLGLGFDAVFPVAAATHKVVKETLSLLERSIHPDMPRPIISSSCPTIIKFIQIRFPSLLSQVEPVLAPMEVAARMARELYKNKGDIDCYFISPCPGKITEAVEPLGGETSSIDGVFSMSDLHLPILHALAERSSSAPATISALDADEIAWGRAGGEGEATVASSRWSCLAADSIDQCTRILESVEDGTLRGIDFLELMACPGGCSGGPLTVNGAALSRHIIQEREKLLERNSSQAATRPDATRPASTPTASTLTPDFSSLRKTDIPARPALLLDSDYRKAMQMMDDMEKIRESLPGLDCGCCGAPNCRALAEDIVHGNGERTDCVIILKEQYRELLGK